ncbi:gamma-mobile-trio integrase GmtZ [Pseudomonas moraviensis]|uniref:gamma-mobile-trio integrase GmtZ n=1 Tax=Pseudomonas moraviensis TaxID=321662 RepID=UPI00068C3881|nr:VPA1269 family protein [Pseudomonas moraviensis]
MAPKKNFYKTINEASEAAKALGISSVQEYLNRYKEDARLPQNPADKYPTDWKGFPNFLGFDNRRVRYATYEEARQAAALIGAYTVEQYKQFRRKDPLLPADPYGTYRDEWTGWGSFLPSNPEVLYYKTLGEAAIASSKLGITSSAEYKNLYSNDPMLHSNPNQYYLDWNGFPDFFDGSFVRYPTYAEAKEAAKSLGATNAEEYKQLCSVDAKLPVCPEALYPDWQTWRDYLPNSVSSKFYQTLSEAIDAVKLLGINTQSEYKARYREDERLPSNPNAVYKCEWVGFPFFFGRSNERYPSYAEAKEATSLIGAYTAREYRAKCSVDPKLPAWPDEYYEDWAGWHDYLPKNPVSKFYPTLAEASEAAKKLGITTAESYRKLFHQDSKLPSNIWDYYKDWQGYSLFFGMQVERYTSYSKAKEAAKALGVYTSTEYLACYKNDPLLPARPEIYYPDEWTEWNAFLPPNPRKRQGKYETLAEAARAVRVLGFKTMRDYQAGYKADPKLPAQPNHFYSAEWSGWGEFIGVGDDAKDVAYYETYTLAEEAAKKLNATSRKDYWEKAKQDEKLPPYPEKVYKIGWAGWKPYLGNENVSTKYETYEEARTAARALNFCSNNDYMLNYKERDPRLPGSPAGYFKEKWEGWSDYLGTSRGKDFYSFDDAKRRITELNIRSWKQYQRDYLLDPMLPSNPNVVYEDTWMGNQSFFDQSDVAAYPSLQLAKAAVRALGINSVKEYKSRYGEDPSLPSNPNIKYADEWLGFPDFFDDREPLYETITEASEAAQRLGFRSKKDYLAGYKADPRLPYSPHEKYVGKWKLWGWDAYLGVDKYKDWREAGRAAAAIGITCASDYLKLSFNDPRLPADAQSYYGDEWQGWIPFLIPEKCQSLADVKFVIKLVRIKDSQEYRDQQKLYPCLPAHPDRMFSAEWIDWFDACAIPRPYSYEEAREIASAQNLASQQEYRSFVAKSNDPRLPRYPDAIYKDEWVNWYVYLGNPEPFKTKNIYDPYIPWKESIERFMEVARGGDAKEAHLCRFVRNYIQRYQLGLSPAIFLTSPRVDLNLFEEFLEDENSENNKRYIISAAKEFCDHYIRTKLTLEDEESGELVVTPNARNPFASYAYEGDGENIRLGESDKPALAFQYVHAMCEWIAPPESNCFKDLEHLHVFDADWVDIDSALIDVNDPDCVYKQEYGRTKIWCPVYWMHAYALASVPARGRQLAYNDSGEGDVEIPEIVDGKIVFQRNQSNLAGTTEQQSFVRKYPEGAFGMHFTSNKTSVRGAAYNVAWMPEALALWMVRLRRWQTKYNPITRPMPWIECTRTDLNPKQRLAKKSNCFLFRDFGDEECGHFSGRLRDRLAAALFYSQPSGLVLSKQNGKASALSAYKSDYTPHSMRVSLITAYVMEFGLPLEIIMKIAGHSAMVMTIYYVKLNEEGLRQKFAAGEKRALSNQAYAAMQMIEQNRIDEIRDTFFNNNEGGFLHYLGSSPPGSFLFRDYGFCPFAGARCGDGGPLIGSTQVRQPVAAGYLGFQNCPHCRHFVTGPVFIGGLLSLANEISLQANYQFEQISSLECKIEYLKQCIEEQEDAQYETEQAGEKFDPGERNSLELKIRKLNSEMESAAKKADMFLCDIQAISRLINQSQAMINERIAAGGQSNLTQLIVQSGNELHVAIAMEETSKFHQLNEVCENAEIYESASADLAIAPRSQMIDKMIAFNNLKPKMYTLNKEQQLVIGNQLTTFILSRVESWTKMDALIEGRMRLEDLGSDEQIALTDIQSILDGGQAVIAPEVR